MKSILIVEDSDSLRSVLKTVLENEGYEVVACPNAEEALQALRSKTFSCILADFKLPGKNGLDFLREAREIVKSVPFLIMTAYGSIDIAIQAMKSGANDFVTKPFEPQTLVSIIAEMIEHKRIIDRSLGVRGRRERSFITQDPVTEKLLYQARKVAHVDSSVLILGESGTGKELVARYIHEHSSRSDKPFVAVNCAALPSELLESEFFGYEAGAFTGATQTRIGVLELASEGTIFLDEVGDMPLSLQVKLLRALQEGEIKRIGSNKTLKVHPRVIAASNHNMEEAIKEGYIREDFYYRLAVVSFTVPPLRERKADIKVLTNYFVDYFCNVNGKKPLTLDADSWRLLENYSWPGNTRELENVIERACIMAEDQIKLENLGLNLGSSLDSLSDSSASLTEIASRAARKAEVDLITRILSQTLGNKTKAAQLLGVSYKTLLNKVKEYNIHV